MHGRQAVAFLEPTPERWWFGYACWVLGLNLYHLGDFAPALQEFGRVREIGESIGDSRLQTFAAWATGWVQALAGDHEVGIEACRRGFLLTSDPLALASVHGFLGAAHREAENADEAIPLLEESLRQLGVLVGAGAFRYRQLSGYFTAILSEAYLLRGQIPESRALARSALDVATESQWLVAVGYAQRALGRIAEAEGDLVEAQARLEQALATFGSIEAHYQTARTRLPLAEVHHRRGDAALATAHLRKAHTVFELLRVPHYVERAEALARNLGLDLGRFDS